MEMKKERSAAPIIGGVFFAILALYFLMKAFSIGFYRSTIIVTLVGMLPFAIVAVSLFLRDRGVLLKLGLVLLLAVALVSFLGGFPAGAYEVSNYSYWTQSGSEEFNLFCMLPELCRLLGAAFLAFMGLAGLSGRVTNRMTNQKMVEAVWYLPASLVLLSIVFRFLAWVWFNYHWWGAYAVFVFGHYGCYTDSILGVFILEFMRGIGYLLVGLWIAYPYSSAECRPEPEGELSFLYCGLVKHILLLLLTLGVWYFIWVYRTTRSLNCVEEEPLRNPAHQLLLCLFVPFYSIYWIYKSAQRIDKLAAQRGTRSDLSTLCLILAVFIPIIPPILMQDGMNSIALRTKPAAPSPAPEQAPEAHAAAAPCLAEERPADVPVRRRPAGGPVKSVAEIVAELRTYKELLDEEILTHEEFDIMKKRLLDL